MRIKNIEVEFSFSDADDLERLENAAKKVKEISAEYEKKELSVSEAIREECKIINDFFDEVFEKGISEKLFNGKNDLKEHIDLFKDIIDEKVRQTNAFQNMYNNIEYNSKYMPSREQRRFNKYKGRK